MSLELWEQAPKSKKCTDCGESFPRTPEHFYRNRHKYDGLDHVCKPCKSIREKRYKERKVARQNAKQRALVRLSHLYPEAYDRLFKEEFAHEGFKLNRHARQDVML